MFIFSAGHMAANLRLTGFFVADTIGKAFSADNVFKEASPAEMLVPREN